MDASENPEMFLTRQVACYPKQLQQSCRQSGYLFVLGASQGSFRPYSFPREKPWGWTLINIMSLKDEGAIAVVMKRKEDKSEPFDTSADLLRWLTRLRQVHWNCASAFWNFNQVFV